MSNSIIRKIFSFVVLSAVLFSLVSCGSKPEAVTSGTIYYGRRGVKVQGKDRIWLTDESYTFPWQELENTSIIITDYEGYAYVFTSGIENYEPQGDEWSASEGMVLYIGDGKVAVCYGKGDLKGELIARIPDMKGQEIKAYFADDFTATFG